MNASSSKKNLLKLLNRLWNHLSLRRQRQLVVLLCLMLISAFAEVISLGAVLPFLGVLIAPEKVYAYPLVSDIVKAFGITSPNQLTLVLTIIFALLVMAAGVLRVFLLWLSTKISYASGADLSLEVYRRTLYQKYQIQTSRNSSEVISGITNKVNGVSVGILLALLTIISSSILMLSIAVTMFVINAKIAILASLGFGLSYIFTTVAFRSKLRANSHRIAKEEVRVIKALQEGLGGIRDVLLDSTQPVYCEIYRKADQPLRVAAGNNLFIAQSPRYIIESLGILMIVGLAFSLSDQPGGIAASMPTLGALALGAQRLLPALQLIYSSWASIVGHFASLSDTIDLLDQPLPEGALLPPPPSMPFNNKIEIKDVSFRYSEDGPWILNNINLTIPKGSRVGFVGTTGSGKSTTLDFLMGLLEATSGSLIVDNQKINSTNVRSWQQIIAHVPQNIYLADTTLAENIAFGVPTELIEMDRVKKAAEQAQIAEFIESRPLGYQAFLGERGVQLSGGQRQRIGIARALYKKASILVFDEATSALDTTTEQSVMQAIGKLDSHITVLLIAHRLTTLQHCDFVVEMANGRIIEQGSYQQMLERSLSFEKKRAEKE